MMNALRSAMVIARRDFVATVFSRYFLMFLLGPMIALGFAALTAMIGGKADDEALRPSVAVIAKADDAKLIVDAQKDVVQRLGGRDVPDIRIVAPSGDANSQAIALLAQPKGAPTAVLTGWPGSPHLSGSDSGVESVEGPLSLILDKVAANQAFEELGTAQSGTEIGRGKVVAPPATSRAAQHLLAKGAQTLLFMLTMLLAGMMLSNLVEEKSNKVIEVLAAALPVDRIFLGKLIAMVGVSLTGIAVWGTLIGYGLTHLLPHGAPPPTPAVGWPMMVVLGVTYYITNYMLLGGIFLGIGAQAASVREVQTLSMPVTMSQMALFFLVSASPPGSDGWLARFVEIFPLSSPLAMVGRATLDDTLWPHLLAIGWQAIWVAIIIRFAASRFRTGVLKSGAPSGGRGPFWRRGKTS